MPCFWKTGGLSLVIIFIPNVFLWMNVKPLMKAIAKNFTEKFLFCKDFWFFFFCLVFSCLNNIKDCRNHRNPYYLYALEFVYGRKIIGAVVIWHCFSTKNLVRAIFVLLKSSKFEEQEDVIKYISFSKYLSPPLTKIGTHVHIS